MAIKMVYKTKIDNPLKIKGNQCIFAAIYMKHKAIISKFRKLLPVFCAAIISLFIVCNESFQHHSFKEKAENKTSSTAGQDAEEIVMVSYKAIVPLLQLNLHSCLYFIFDTGLVEKPLFNAEVFVPAFSNTYFTTLFRQIISPNAP